MKIMLVCTWAHWCRMRGDIRDKIVDLQNNDEANKNIMLCKCY